MVSTSSVAPKVPPTQAPQISPGESSEVVQAMALSGHSLPVPDLGVPQDDFTPNTARFELGIDVPLKNHAHLESVKNALDGIGQVSGARVEYQADTFGFSNGPKDVYPFDITVTGPPLAVSQAVLAIQKVAEQVGVEVMK